MSRLIVVNLGLPKSGTTTLAHALREARLNVADYRLRREDTDTKTLHGKFVGGQIYRGYFASGDPLETLAEFDAFTEISVLRRGHSLWPQTDYGVIDAIRTLHPGVKFLASTRAPQDHALSMLRWSDLGTDRLPRANVPGLPRGFGQTTLERARWIAAHHAFLRKIFANDDCFLEYAVADPEAKIKIGAHLGRDLPWWGPLNADPSKSGTPKTADSSPLLNPNPSKVA